MQLTRHTDYALRVLMYLGLHPGELVTISEISAAYGISRNHLMKVVHEMANAGFILTYRGKAGGMQLAGEPATINVGEVIRRMEGNLEIINCLEPRCPIQTSCLLKGVLDDARNAFLAVLDQHTLADLLGRNRRKLRGLLELGLQ